MCYFRFIPEVTLKGPDWPLTSGVLYEKLSFIDIKPELNDLSFIILPSGITTVNTGPRIPKQFSLMWLVGFVWNINRTRWLVEGKNVRANGDDVCLVRGLDLEGLFQESKARFDSEKLNNKRKFLASMLISGKYFTKNPRTSLWTKKI